MAWSALIRWKVVKEGYNEIFQFGAFSKLDYFILFDAISTASVSVYLVSKILLRQ